MAITYVRLATTTLTSTAASINFTNIDATYTDLVVKFTGRSNADDGSITTRLNNSSSGYNNLRYFINGGSVATVASNITDGWSVTGVGSSTFQSNYFGAFEIYITNYATTLNKSALLAGTSPNSTTPQYTMMTAALWANSATINRIEIGFITGNLIAGTTATLYGIKNTV